MLSHRTGGLPGGTYFVHWYYEARAARGASCEVRVTADGTVLGESAESGAGRHRAASGFGLVTLAAGDHVVELAFRSPDGASPVAIRNVRLVAWKLP